MAYFINLGVGWKRWMLTSHGIGHKGEELAVMCQGPPDLTHCGTGWMTSPVDFLLCSLPAPSLPVTDFVNTVTLVTAMSARHVTRTLEGQSSFCHCQTSDLPETKTHAASLIRLYTSAVSLSLKKPVTSGKFIASNLFHSDGITWRVSISSWL